MTIEAWRQAIILILGWFVPSLLTERQAGAWDDCGRRAAAMLAKAMGKELPRNGETIMGTGGVRGQGPSTAQFCVDELRKIGCDVKVESLTPAEYIRRSRAGEASVVNVHYASLPADHIEQPGNADFGHSIFNAGANVAYGNYLMDPLKIKDAQGEWVADNELIKAATAFLGDGRVQCIMGKAIGVDSMSKAFSYNKTPHHVIVPAGTPLYEDTSKPPFMKTVKAIEMEFLGNVHDESGVSYVVYEGPETAKIWTDGKARPTAVLVHKWTPFVPIAQPVTVQIVVDTKKIAEWIDAAQAALVNAEAAIK